MALVLETIGLTRFFGQVAAADDVTVGIEAGEFVGIVGPNGAGKTTFVNLVTGYLEPEEGRIRYRGQDITGLPPREVTKLGVARSFQIPQLYTNLTVLENMLIALATRDGRSLDFWSSLKQSNRIGEALDTLEQFGLQDYAQRPVSELPEGGRKLLDIALSFALQPQVLFLDEPTSGVSMKDKFEVMNTLVEVLQRTGVTAIFIEHDMEVIDRYAERVLVFNKGRIVADGDPQTVLSDAEIRRVVVG